jgi:hypothetical protein
VKFQNQQNRNCIKKFLSAGIGKTYRIDLIHKFVLNMSLRKIFTAKRIVVGFIVVLLFIQLFRIDTTNPKSDPAQDFIYVTKPEKVVADILTRACYDCHSNNSKYPWYSQVAPISWWLKNHINEGREELNFSLWAGFSPKKKDRKMEEAIELVKEGEMPLNTYTWAHKEARLTPEEKTLIVNWFQSQRIGQSAAEEQED